MAKKRILDTVGFLNPRTRRIYTRGGTPYNTEPATGAGRTAADNELIDHGEETLAGRRRRPEGMGSHDAG
jgi:hypothetical protein